MSQLQIQQPMTSQIRSHIEYLIETYNILVLIYITVMLHWRFLMRFNDAS